MRNRKVREGADDNFRIYRSPSGIDFAVFRLGYGAQEPEHETPIIVILGMFGFSVDLLALRAMPFDGYDAKDPFGSF